MKLHYHLKNTLLLAGIVFIVGVMMLSVVPYSTQAQYTSEESRAIADAINASNHTVPNERGAPYMDTERQTDGSYTVVEVINWGSGESGGESDPLTPLTPSVSIGVSPILIFKGQTVTVNWSNANLPIDSVCSITTSEPTNVDWTTVDAKGSSSRDSVEPLQTGITQFIYSCVGAGVSYTQTAKVEVISTFIDTKAVVVGPNCFIGLNQSTCQTKISWDTYVRNVTNPTYEVRNITTNQLYSTNSSEEEKLVELVYGDNQIRLRILSGGSVVEEDTIITKAECDQSLRWDGEKCVGDGWVVISDIGFYGKAYVGMPARNGGSHTHEKNTSCVALKFWACDVRANQPPVKLDFIVDGAVVHTDYANSQHRGNLFTPWWANISRYRYVPGCGYSDHKLTDYYWRIPDSLKDGVERTVQIKATRSDGQSKFVTFNGWEGYRGYPNTPYQNFPLRCDPVPQNIDLTAKLNDVLPTFTAPNRVMNVPYSMSGIVQNIGLLNTTATAFDDDVQLHFSYGDQVWTRGKNGDFVVNAKLSALASLASTTINFPAITHTATGTWYVRMYVDVQKRIETNPDTHHNNRTKWYQFTVTEAPLGIPTASIIASGCTIPLNQERCNVNVVWSSTNLINPRIRRDGAEIYSNPAYSLRDSLAPGTYIYTIQDGSNPVLDSDTVTVRCADGLVRQNGVCVAGTTPPTAVIVPDVRFGSDTSKIIRSGSRARISWVFSQSSFAGACTVSGPGISSMQISSTGFVITEPLRSFARYQISCSHPTNAYPAFTIPPANVSVIPVSSEI